ncbi:MAG: hypothetical protein DRH37_07980 [Deltaproteobacteria bacterium]|nr:MAG: hypothetical protein DRH37_07980 [Deltaproteobacteria bacterium]
MLKNAVPVIKRRADLMRKKKYPAPGAGPELPLMFQPGEDSERAVMITAQDGLEEDGNGL